MIDTFYSLTIKNKNNLVNDLVDHFKTYTKISYDPLNTYNSAIHIIGSDYRWNKLNEEGKRSQTQLYKRFKKFKELITVISRDLPARDKRELIKLFKYTEDYLLQNKRPYVNSSNEVIEKIKKYFNELIKVLDSLDFKEEGIYVFVPDTNALLLNPNIEEWKFSEIGNFNILLLPTVLSELDKLKIAHQNRDLKDKARKIINKIKEYRRRGKLTEGVVVTKNIKLSALALEPNFGNSLDWLDSKNNDDRIIASFIEICRINIRNKVCLVTSDINLQNKLEFADLQYIEPPENE